MKTWSDFNISVPNHGGAERYTTCPQCSPQRKRANQRKPCLSINLDKEVWFCHHCGWSGTLKSGVDRSRRELHWNKPEFIRPTYDPHKGMTAQAVQWFENRGIPEAVTTRNKITTGNIFMPQDGEVVNAIQFPFYRMGECINIKYRDHHKHFRMEGNAERILYGLDDIQEVTVIVEGEMDKLALEVAGIPNCVSVPDGAPAEESRDYSSKFEFMENCKAELETVKQFIIAVDMDPPGRRLEEELVHRLGKHRCAIVRWPTDCKDANDTLLKYGPDEIVTRVYGSEPPPIDGVVRVREMMERLERYYDEGRKPGLHPGWQGLVKYYKVSPGEWTLVTGIPGHGKSEFLDALLVNIANDHDWCFAIYSPENSSLEEHVAKLLEKKVGLPFRGAEGFRMSKEELRQAASWVDHHFHFLELDGETNLKLDTILDLTRELIAQHGIRGLVIDPWNELEHERPPNLTETEYISKCLSKLRLFVRHHNIHIWVVAHPTKLQKDAKGNYPVPTPYDVTGSANWRNKAFNCLSVWRDPTQKDDPVQVHIQKIKFKKNGHVGKCDLIYDTLTGRFSDVLQAM
jgi:twinkle protein